jgi:hypothetical protein
MKAFLESGQPAAAFPHLRIQSSSCKLLVSASCSNLVINSFLAVVLPIQPRFIDLTGAIGLGVLQQIRVAEWTSPVPPSSMPPAVRGIVGGWPYPSGAERGCNRHRPATKPNAPSDPRQGRSRCPLGVHSVRFPVVSGGPRPGRQAGFPWESLTLGRTARPLLVPDKRELVGRASLSCGSTPPRPTEPQLLTPLGPNGLGGVFIL